MLLVVFRAMPLYLGASRGFAFVEFNQLPDAVRWMEINQVASSLFSPHLN